MLHISLGYSEIQLTPSRQIKYVRNGASMTLADAQAWCSGLNGNLPVPTSAEENEFLASLGSTWLGFTTDDMSGLTFDNWRKGASDGRPDEPSGDSTEVQLIAEDKWGIRWDGHWNDADVANWPATCYVTTGICFESGRLFW